jgi:hypothetical protein
MITSSIFAQGDIDDENKVLIRNEQTYYVALNSNGWSGGFSIGKMVNIYRKKLYSAEFSLIKDAKELKINPYHPEYNRFVYGKNNVFFNLRFSYGNLMNLYQKKDKAGVEVRWFYNIGPVIGILKPVYYVTNTNPYQTEKFSSSLHTITSIYGGAPFMKGTGELSFVPGGFAKVGASFEFSKKDILVNALEGGVSLDIFAKNIDIMANDNNRFYFLAIFVSYRFGKIINPRAVKNKKQEDE